MGKLNFKLMVKERPFLFREELVFVDLAATTFSGVAGPFFPLVWHYNLRKLLLTCVSSQTP